jgi:hypothetical protein
MAQAKGGGASAEPKHTKITTSAFVEGHDDAHVVTQEKDTVPTTSRGSASMLDSFKRSSSF